MNVKLRRPTGKALSELSILLHYPQDDFFEVLRSVTIKLKPFYPKVAENLEIFENAVDCKNIDEIKERYTRTFDLAPLCNPYLSSYIYGEENYDRGKLMSSLKEKYDYFDIDLRGDLPDHLGYVLLLAEKLNTEEIEELAYYCLEQPLKRMSELLKSSNNPYALVLDSITHIIKTDLLGGLVS